MGSLNFSRTLHLPASVLICLFAAVTSAAASVNIQWDTNSSVVRATIGTAQLSQEQLPEVLTVAVEPANVLSSLGLPPVAGTYSQDGGQIEFHPRFAFEPGVAYRATLQLPGKPVETSLLRLPRPVFEPSTIVSEIFPTAAVLPQNLLKFYIHFSAPMSGGHIYDHLHLAQADGTPVELPFLEIDEELWNPQMTRLTLFLDPGRIKREVKPLQEVGPALVPGKSYIMSVDRRWRDARGVELKAAFEKRFDVAEPDRDSPDPKQWRVTAPAPESRAELRILFEDPIDHALGLRLITVKDSRGAFVSGEKSLDRNETLWNFKPDLPWKPGRYQILIESTIEDLAGNNIGKPFEVDLAEGERRREPPRTVRLGFEIK